MILDASVDGTISIGGGDHGLGCTLRTADPIRALGAQVAEVSTGET